MYRIFELFHFVNRNQRHPIIFVNPDHLLIYSRDFEWSDSLIHGPLTIQKNVHSNVDVVAGGSRHIHAFRGSQP